MPSPLSLPLADLPDPLPVPPIRPRPGDAPIRASVTPPGSKSLTNRLLLLAALCDGESTLRNPLLDADDAQRMLAALELLGVSCSLSPVGERAGAPRSPSTTESSPIAHSPLPIAPLTIHGVAGRWRPTSADLTLNLNNAGTATRFLAAASLLSPTPITIDGNERMRQRPIAELVTSLRQLGAKVEHLADPVCPPIRITPPAELATSTIEIPTTQSSQFISALLLIAPWMPRGLTLKLVGPVTSASYVRMTLALLEALEVEVQATDDLSVIRVPHSPPRAFDIDVEPDASGATYFWAAGAIIPRATVRVEGLGASSLQADAGFPDLLARMGAHVTETDGKSPSISVSATDRIAPIIADMSDMPDAAMTLAVVASFAPAPSVIRGVRTLRVKETDRIAALQTELAKVGVRVDADVNADPDTMTITPPKGGIDCSDAAPPVTFDTYDDHRMAMSLALIGLKRPNISIADPGCVAKTYPGYWADLAKLFPG